MTKRLVAILCILVFVVVIVAGCGANNTGNSQQSSSVTAAGQTSTEQTEVAQKEDPGDKGGTLTGICPTGIEDSVRRAISNLRARYPKWKIDISFAGDFENKIKIALGANEGLDIMWSGGSDYPQIWGEQGVLVPLDPYLQQEGLNMDDVYIKAYADELKYNGQQVLLPTDCFNYATWINKKVFEKAGVEIPKPDKSYSFEELLEVGKKLTMDTDNDGKTDTWALSLILPTWHIVQPWYSSNGAQVLSDDGKKATGYIDSPEFIDFVTKYRDLMLKYKIAMPLDIAPDGDSWGIAWSNGFLAGKVAMHVSAPWMIPEANNQQKAHPELLDWTTILPPHLSGDKPASIGGTAGWGIPVTCPEDKRLMAFRTIWEIAAGAGAEYWYEQGKMWTTKVGMENFASKSALNAGWVEAAKFMVPMEQANKLAWKSSVDPNLVKYISAAVLGKMDPAEACHQAAKEIDAAIATYEASK